MKKLIFTAAMLLGVGALPAFAEDIQTTQTPTEVAVADTDEFITIDAKELPQAIQDAIAKEYADLAINEAAVSKKDGVNTFRVILAGDGDTTTTVIFNENGEVLK